MTYEEDDLLPLSALQHLVYCERQCALIHIECVWTENQWTAEGRILHERVHQLEHESRGTLRIARGLRLRSNTLGVAGVADVVEFHRCQEKSSGGVGLPGVAGSWRPYPVEYKRGRPKADHCDEVQLCAQAVCLEEMLDTEVAAGALFYGRTRRRHDVVFDKSIRQMTAKVATRLHDLMRVGATPPPVDLKRCTSCSLRDDCLPNAAGSKQAVAYVQRSLDHLLRANGQESR